MLSPLLVPVDTSHNTDENNNFFNLVFESGKPFQGFSGQGLALISLGSDICDPVRKALRTLNTHFKNIQLYDLGYLKDANEENINEIMSICNLAGVVPVFTGYKGSMESTKNIDTDVFIVSNRIYSGITGCNYISYQRHLCKSDDIYVAEEYRYDSISLGKMRSNPGVLEPVLRSVGLLYVNLQALRASDAPNIEFTYPTGLYAEELCQILKNTGTGCQIKGVFIQASFKTELFSQEADLIAESIWYLAEGLNIRINDHPEKSSDHTRFIIHAPSVDEDLEFFKHNQTEKWWLKHPSSTHKQHYLACSYDEYQFSIGDELPDRVFKFLNSIL